MTWRFLTFLAVLFGPVASAKVEPYPESAWFEQDPAPAPLPEVLNSKPDTLNPLDYAGARIGLDVRNVELPRGWEGGYRFCCRFPIIDYVSTRPLYMKQWAEYKSRILSCTHRARGLLAIRYAWGVLAGTGSDRLWPGDTVRACTTVAYSTGGPISPELPRAAFRAFRNQLLRSPFTERYRDVLLDVYDKLGRAWMATREVRVRHTRTDSAFFAGNPGQYLAPDCERMSDLTGNTDGQLEFIDRARDCRLETLGLAVAWVQEAVNSHVHMTAGWQLTDFYADTSKARGTVAFDLPFGRVVIAGFGDDRHSQDAALLIDLGGDDTYTNNAGGCGREGGVAVCIDHGGDDMYLAPDSSYVQGFGFLGVGMLVDLAGNDVYKAKHFSQGAGILGVGVLWDKAGDDTFSVNAFGQGAGMFGLGMMLNDSGNDVYDCATMGQGSATTLGLGILCDLEGNDQYRLACDTTLDALGGPAGYGQGGALSFRAYPWEKKLVAYGGVGMLVDDKGDDTYTSKGWCDQGGSYIMSLGALVDNEGNDHYSCGTGQGSGIHITNAILIDKNGDDVYEGGFRAGGSGGDRSPGFLIDYEGNDVYKSSTSSYGTGCKPFSFSLFIDYKGDDKYICDRPKGDVLFNDWHSFGGVWPESDANLWPYAISLDLGGTDDYQVRNRANNSETHSFGHGIHLDMEWKGGDVIGRVERPIPGQRDFELPSASLSNRYGLDITVLQHADVFGVFEAVGRLVKEGVDPLPGLVAAMLASDSRAFDRNALECLHYWFVLGRIGEKELPDVLGLLKARDPEVRLTIADDLGLWKMSTAEDALIEAARTDSNAQVRRFALRSLLRLESAKALPVAWRLAGNDTSEDVRRMAVNLIGKVRPSGEVLRLLIDVLEKDRASSVRCAAADAIANVGSPDGVEALREAAKTKDVYLLRACGRALCALYQVEGIELLIRSMSFPSIDAFYNYDRNVPNYISAFAGFDLPDSERYVQAKWQAWYDAHRDSIDIKANADALKAWTALTDSLRGEPDSVQIPRYEGFLRRFPKHVRARTELAGKLNGLAWNLATAARAAKKGSALTGRAVTYALRAVELSDDPNIWDTLIEAYLAGGKKKEALQACRDALAMHPDNQMLKDRLRQLERK